MLVTAVRKEKTNTTATLGASNKYQEKERKKEKKKNGSHTFFYASHSSQWHATAIQGTENPHYLHFQDSYDTITILSSYKGEFIWP